MNFAQIEKLFGDLSLENFDPTKIITSQLKNLNLSREDPIDLEILSLCDTFNKLELNNKRDMFKDFLYAIGLILTQRRSTCFDSRYALITMPQHIY